MITFRINFQVGHKTVLQPIYKENLKAQVLLIYEDQRFKKQCLTESKLEWHCA